MSSDVIKIQAIHVQWNKSKVVKLDFSNHIFDLTSLVKAKLLGVELVMKKVKTFYEIDKKNIKWILRLAKDPNTNRLPDEWKEYSGFFTIARKNQEPFINIDRMIDYLREIEDKKNLNQSFYEAWLKKKVVDEFRWF